MLTREEIIGLDKYHKNEKSIKKIDPEVYEYIDSHFEGSWNEKIYQYCYGIPEPCPICGGRPKFHGTTYGYSKYCSLSCKSSAPEVKDKVKQTFIKRYGVDNPMKSNTIKQKAEKTCLEKYGVSHQRKVKSVQDKQKHTCLEKYGGVGFASQLVLEKIQETNLERYGDIMPSKTQSIKDKTIITNLERYGVEWTGQTERVKREGKRTKMLKYGNPYGPQGTSKFEDWISDFLDIYEISYIRHASFDWISELDFYIPSLNLAIEANGTWVHSFAMKPDIEYHFKKTKACKEHNIRLIHVWWHWDKDLIEKVILNALNIQICPNIDELIYNDKNIHLDIDGWDGVTEPKFIPHQVKNIIYYDSGTIEVK